jgi:hypothetical protein
MFFRPFLNPNVKKCRPGTSPNEKKRKPTLPELHNRTGSTNKPENRTKTKQINPFQHSIPKEFHSINIHSRRNLPIHRQLLNSMRHNFPENLTCENIHQFHFKSNGPNPTSTPACRNNRNLPRLNNLAQLRSTSKIINIPTTNRP